MLYSLVYHVKDTKIKRIKIFKWLHMIPTIMYDKIYLLNRQHLTLIKIRNSGSSGTKQIMLPQRVCEQWQQQEQRLYHCHLQPEID